MKATIDVKSAILGLAIGVVAMLAIGAGTSSNEIGRYKMSMSLHSAMILDTTTGQAWAFQPLAAREWRMDTNFFDVK